MYYSAFKIDSLLSIYTQLKEYKIFKIFHLFKSDLNRLGTKHFAIVKHKNLSRQCPFERSPRLVRKLKPKFYAFLNDASVEHKST